MVAKFLPVDPLTLGVGSKGQIRLFQKMVMLHIKLMGNEATGKYIFCPYTHPRTLGWGQRSNIFFVAYQKGNEA